MDFAQQDFDYYERTVGNMYRKFYTKRIVTVAIALVIIAGYSWLINEHLLLNGLLIVILLGLLVYLVLQRGKFPEIYQDLLAGNQPQVVIDQVQEDEYSYNIYREGEKIARVNKNGVRNLPSANKTYTLMAGFDKKFFSNQPLRLVYYDMLELTYEEKFRLSRGGYSSMPRFLRRFTWSNLKASAGNAVSFIIGNLFFLFILFRLIRYVISLIRMMF
ncbi:hypothetical protein [Enterococcus diestrammenae]|uniref:YcxB-like protein domain-containing protein n=1 Tax=Enterococcus diestrammenae TaxID=1155073 RepID=A0ABV0F7T2_9ENTE|nr:hypothetical protein [Enterococcus diestrammenae]KAF1295478.1 hypothetical protein BAU18_02520 [Enterococcus diestrammenae]